jgi:hypothetical protein
LILGERLSLVVHDIDPWMWMTSMVQNRTKYQIYLWIFTFDIDGGIFSWTSPANVQIQTANIADRMDG